MTTIIQFYAVYMGPVKEHKALRYLFRKYVPPLPPFPPVRDNEVKETAFWFAPEHPELGYVTEDQLVFEQPTPIWKKPMGVSEVKTVSGHKVTVMRDQGLSMLMVPTLQNRDSFGNSFTEIVVFNESQRLELVKALEGK